ncbi:MAG: hypothetical protein OEQ53_08225, partial [Saprospiraceae bacterium]|nr:hypothetical protein [Saprospiraceae bacterium]
PLIYEDGKSASEISRKDEIFESDNGLISIAGGKLTGYRKMAERVVDLVWTKMNKSDDVLCRTKEIPLTAKHFSSIDAVNDYRKVLTHKLDKLQQPAIYIDYLLQNYGSQSDYILEQMDNDPSSDTTTRLLRAELEFCMQNEMVVTPADFLIRRTGRLYFLPSTISKVEDLVCEITQKEWPGLTETHDLLRGEWDLTRKTQVDFS